MERFCRFSDRFCISCGTVTIDTRKDDLPVLLIRWRKTGEYFLPKGRKDMGETLQEAAERETYEETGVRARILPLNFITLATAPDGISDEQSTPVILNEPFAVTGRETDGILKIIYWFVATGDSTVLEEQGTQQPGEDFESHWVPLHNVTTSLSWQDDREVAQGAARVYQTSRAITESRDACKRVKRPLRACSGPSPQDGG